MGWPQHEASPVSAALVLRFRYPLLQFLDLIFVHLPVKLAAPEILAGFVNDDAAEAEQGDEVWYRHQGIHTVGDIPYQSEADDTAQEDTHNIQHAIDEHPALSLEILYAAFAIIAPSQGGAEGEGGEADGKQWGSYVWYLAEGCLGERCAIVVIDIRIGDDAGGDDQSREGTDDDGIPEGSGRGYQRLAYRIAGLGGGSYDRCRTEFVISSSVLLFSAALS